MTTTRSKKAYSFLAGKGIWPTRCIELPSGVRQYEYTDPLRVVRRLLKEAGIEG